MEGAELTSRAVIHIQDNQGAERVFNAVAGHGNGDVIDISSDQPRYASTHLLNNTREARERYLSLGVPLYKAALRGDWETAKPILDTDERLLTASISIGGLNVLHFAAGTKYVHFVELLVGMMSQEDLELRDEKRNTAFCFAVATGTVQVAEILLQKNMRLATMRGGEGMMPLYLAALFGRSEMASFLYPKTVKCLKEEDQIGIFFTCINSGLYDLSLKMLQANIKLAESHDKDGKTALHLLARTPSAFHNQSPKGWSKLIKSCFNYGCKNSSKPDKALELVRFLWKLVLDLGDEEAMGQIRSSELLFDATKLGNFEFLAELINSYPDLVWETDSQNRSIIHIAVLYRHANIFNLIHDIGPIKDLLATYKDGEENNILHLAAKLPPDPDRLNTVSGPALQMQQELLWFEAVKKIVQPPYIKAKNKKGKRPEELFSAEHKTLMRNGVGWMRSTAESCMLVATLIATVVFAAAFTLPGGNNDKGTPNDLQSTSFLIFVLSDGLALLNSIVSVVMFLSILVSRYREHDFLKRLPLKLMIGLTSLFFSMINMMIAFSFSFVIAYDHGLKWVPFLISLLAIIPIAMFAILKFPLLLDTFNSTYCSGTLFQPNRHMLY